MVQVLDRFVSPQEELFRRLGDSADGATRDDIINAAGNLLLNALRQKHRTLGDANEELDDLVQRMKAALKEKHYSQDGSRPRQNIVVPRFRLD